MGITVEFDGFYRNRFRNVTPDDIVLKGRTLTIKGVRVPVAEQRLYDVFYFLRGKTYYRHGKVTVALLKDGSIKYYCDTSNHTADYFASKIIEFGMARNYDYLPHEIKKIPDDDTYLTGWSD